MSHERKQIEDIVVVPEKSEEFLNQRQLMDYREFRESLINSAGLYIDIPR